MHIFIRAIQFLNPGDFDRQLDTSTNVHEKLVANGWVAAGHLFDYLCFRPFETFITLEHVNYRLELVSD